MNNRRISAIILRQFYLMRSSPARVLPLFAWVAVDIFLWGFITRYLSSIASPGFNLVPAILGAVLLWDFFTRVMFGVTTAFFEDVWSRNFLNVFASPLTISEYLIGLVLTSIATSLVGLLVMLILATTLFGLSIFAYGLLLIPFLLILFLFGVTLGIFGCAMVLRLGPASEWLIWPIPAMLSPFVAVFYPLSTLPRWMQCVSRVLPPSYVFEGIRTIVHGGQPPLAMFAFGGVLCCAYILLAAWMFFAVFRRAVRTGLIARYSAETLN